MSNHNFFTAKSIIQRLDEITSQICVWMWLYGRAQHMVYRAKSFFLFHSLIAQKSIVYTLLWNGTCVKLAVVIDAIVCFNLKYAIANSHTFFRAWHVFVPAFILYFSMYLSIYIVLFLTLILPSIKFIRFTILLDQNNNRTETKNIYRVRTQRVLYSIGSGKCESWVRFSTAQKSLTLRRRKNRNNCVEGSTNILTIIDICQSKGKLD